MQQKKTLENVLARIMRITALLAHHDNLETVYKPNSANKAHQKHNRKQHQNNFTAQIVQSPKNDVR
jgi:hypothetical protein